jgi:lipoprotein-releasing system permease protein
VLASHAVRGLFLLVLAVTELVVAGVFAIASLWKPWLQRPLASGLICAVMAAGMVKLYLGSFERFAGVRYLHHRRDGRRQRAVMGFVAATGAGLVAGLALFFFGRGHSRVVETVGVVLVLIAGLLFVFAVVLRLFSIFTSVSVMGVVLGLMSLLVMLAVTTGFEREFQDKVLALNAHLIVIPYGNIDVESVEADDIEKKLKDLPGVVRRAKFLFSAGEVMVGKVGANLKGIDLAEGADDLKRALVDGSIADLARPTTCPGGGGGGGGTPAEKIEAGRIVLGTELAHRLRTKVGECVSIMVPFSNAGDVTPPAFPFRVVGLFRMGFNEYDTRLAYVSLQDARRLSSARQSVFGVELRFADPMQAIAIAEEVRRRLDGPYRVVDWQELNHNLFEALRTQKTWITVLLVFVVTVAALNILGSLILIVRSKVREIAILKSMGTSSSVVARMFLVLGTTIGAVGAALGIGCGLLVCGMARLYGYRLDPKVYLIGELPVQISLYEIVAFTAPTLALCVLATLIPSLIASRMRAADGLRYI